MVYLLHFSEPLGDPSSPRGQAQHYLGSADDLDRRLAAHTAGNGARIMAAVTERGIAWRLARTWPGGRAEERQLKRRKNNRQLCPICWQKEKTP